MDAKTLRRALLTLKQAGELNVQHVYGEMQSLWEARETVRDFLKGGNICPPPQSISKSVGSEL